MIGSGSEQTMLLPMIEQARQVADERTVRTADAEFHTELMKRATDSVRGRAIHSRRIATVEPVFANVRHSKGLD